MSTALGDAGAAKATAAIARQMQKLLAADVVYAAVVRPEINGVLADNGIEGDDVPKSAFLPGRDQVAGRKRGQRGARRGQRRRTGAATAGVHGLGLIGVSINGTELGEEAADASPPKKRRKSKSQVAEPGRIDRERRSASRSPSTAATLHGSIERSAPAKPRP